MSINKIKTILNDYEWLLKFTEDRIKIIEKYDNKYNTLLGILRISFEDDLVHVECDNSAMGCYDTHGFSFPIEWLGYEDVFELAEIVFDEKIKREEKLLEAKKERELKLKEESEKKDIETYLKLKEKYGSVHGL